MTKTQKSEQIKPQKITIKNNRKAVTFKMNEELTDQFTMMTKYLGLTTCEVLEGIAAAFVKGTSFITSPNKQMRPRTTCIQFPWICFTLHVNIVRQVLRSRRYAHEIDERQVNPYLNFDMPYGETYSELMGDY